LIQDIFQANNSGLTTASMTLPDDFLVISLQPGMIQGHHK
jgi:hypothetical protein